MSGYYIGVLTGPVIGPVIGGSMVQRWDWRALQWFLVIYGAASLLLILFTLPETLRKEPLVLIGSDSTPLEHKTPAPPTRCDKLISTSRRGLGMLFGPLHVIALFRSPIILVNVYLASSTFLILRMFAVILQDDFAAKPYSFDNAQLGLVFLPYTLGLFLGDIFAGKWADSKMKSAATAAERYNSEGRLICYPEDRVKENAWIGVLLFSGSLLWYGWTVHAGSFWAIPVGFQCLSL